VRCPCWGASRSVKVFRKEGHLVLEIPGQPYYWLFAASDTKFFLARIYKRRAAAVGLEATQIAGNSTRIGAAQDLMAAGFASYRSKNYPGKNYRGEKQRGKIRA
jgi:hypothetical protein